MGILPNPKERKQGKRIVKRKRNRTMSKVLEIGEYTLEDGVTLERTGKFVTVRPIDGYDNKPRCKECKHFGSGKATRCGYTTTICLLQPKRVVDKDGKELYYHIGARRLACEKFEKKY